MTSAPASAYGQKVDFVRTTREIRVSEQYEKYQFRQDRRWHWLQRLALWTLRKLHCYAQMENVSLHRHVIDGLELRNAMLAQHDEIVRMYDRRGGRILMGQAEFAELTRIDLYQLMSMGFEFNWSGPGSHTATIHQMKITIVPWMKGILVLPKDLDV